MRYFKRTGNYIEESIDKVNVELSEEQAKEHYDRWWPEYAGSSRMTSADAYQNGEMCLDQDTLSPFWGDEKTNEQLFSDGLRDGVIYKTQPR